MSPYRSAYEEVFCTENTLFRISRSSKPPAHIIAIRAFRPDGDVESSESGVTFELTCSEHPNKWARVLISYQATRYEGKGKQTVPDIEPELKDIIEQLALPVLTEFVSPKKNDSSTEDKKTEAGPIDIGKIASTFLTATHNDKGTFDPAVFAGAKASVVKTQSTEPGRYQRSKGESVDGVWTWKADSTVKIPDTMTSAEAGRLLGLW